MSSSVKLSGWVVKTSVGSAISMAALHLHPRRGTVAGTAARSNQRQMDGGKNGNDDHNHGSDKVNAATEQCGDVNREPGLNGAFRDARSVIRRYVADASHSTETIAHGDFDPCE